MVKAIQKRSGLGLRILPIPIQFMFGPMIHFSSILRGLIHDHLIKFGGLLS